MDVVEDKRWEKLTTLFPTHIRIYHYAPLCFALLENVFIVSDLPQLPSTVKLTCISCLRWALKASIFGPLGSFA